jgi:hypothetical protein
MAAVRPIRDNGLLDALEAGGMTGRSMSSTRHQRPMAPLPKCIFT